MVFTLAEITISMLIGYSVDGKINCKLKLYNFNYAGA